MEKYLYRNIIKRFTQTERHYMHRETHKNESGSFARIYKYLRCIIVTAVCLETHSSKQVIKE